MKKLLYIDACIRGNESRTRRIAEPLMEALEKDYAVQRLVLNDLNLSVVQKDLLKERNSGNIDPTVIRLIWVLVTIASCGTGLIAYIIAALVMPESNEVY